MYGNPGAAFLLLLIVLLVVALVGSGLMLLVVFAVRRARGARALGNLWTAVALLAVGVAIPTAGLVVGALNADPDPLRFDLRDGMAASDLPGTESPGFPGFYDYDTSHVEWQLPDGRAISAEVDSVVVTVAAGQVSSAEFSLIAEPSSAAKEHLSDWAAQVGVLTEGLADAPSGRDWRRTVTTAHSELQLWLQSVGDGSKAIPRFQVQLTDG